MSCCRAAPAPRGALGAAGWLGFWGGTDADVPPGLLPVQLVWQLLLGHLQLRDSRLPYKQGTLPPSCLHPLLSAGPDPAPRDRGGQVLVPREGHERQLAKASLQRHQHSAPSLPAVFWPQNLSHPRC